MSLIYRNPNLIDYFVERDDVSLGALSSKSTITTEYESGNVIVFPRLKFDIDYSFWSDLPTDAYPGLKKLTSLALNSIDGEDALLEKNLAKAQIPMEMENKIRSQIRSLYSQVVPVYESVFGDYKFSRRQAVWRLNTIYNENLHIDTYLEEYSDHFARLFINLDTQPRIWHTSYTAEELFKHFAHKIDRKVFEEGSKAQIWIELNKAAFGGSSKMWWDQQPRHVAYFFPGDVWAVDSRQVSHQIFYGRRALSIDFFVDVNTMQTPGKQYLNMIQDFRERFLKS